VVSPQCKRGRWGILTGRARDGVTRLWAGGDLAPLVRLQELPFAGAGASQGRIAELAAIGAARYGYRRIHVLLAGRAGR